MLKEDSILLENVLKKFNNGIEVDIPSEDYFEINEHPCRCSIDCEEVLNEIETFLFLKNN